ncbi:MAG TPA: hypothetical protein VFW95_09275 [Candidatus Limnocylindria bacterium]|nr:hypothetical protein [Candidatus Limnocylindria bacterium]
MARRPGEPLRLNLSPRSLRLAGWLVALVLVLGIAAAVRLLGGNGGDVVATSPSPSAGSLPPIAFGTALDDLRGVVAGSETTTFMRGQTFAYSVPDAAPASAVYVEVVRVGGGPQETVQEPVEAQAIANGPGPIGFTVPANILLDVFGPGRYVMTIYLDPAGRPIASGAFELVEAASSASPSP